MKKISIFLCFLTSVCLAEDFGVVSKTYPVIEPDMIEVIKSKAKLMVENGQWEILKQKSIANAKNKVYHPTSIAGITHVKQTRTFYYDPTFKIDSDITDGQGHIIAKAGYYNPLRFKPFPEELIFIDGLSNDQIEWAIARFKTNSKKTKIILTSGSFVDLSKKYKVWFFYDQNGKYTEKLGITHVPATVNQEGKRLRIDEVMLKGESD